MIAQRRTQTAAASGSGILVNAALGGQAFELPTPAASSIRELLGRRLMQLTAVRIWVRPMSEDWLRQCEADLGRGRGTF